MALPVPATQLVAEVFEQQKVRLDDQQLDRFARYLELLARWNEAINLTSIRDPRTMVLRHFVEPVLARGLLAGAGPRLVDVGSGPGVPGLPLKIIEPERECVLVESSGKKANFLREVVDELALEDVLVLEGRLEELILDEDFPRPVHLLTARAWTGYGPMLGRMARLMAPGGRAILWVGESGLRELRRHLVTAGGPPTDQKDWAGAARAGWEIRRALHLRHLDHGYAVALELPSA